MISKIILYVVIASSCVFGFESLDTLKPSSSASTQEEAVRQLIKRTIPNEAHKFSIKVTAILEHGVKDVFQVRKLDNGTIHIIGSTGVAAATGFHHYLKYFCNCHISWEVTNLNLPEDLPDVNIEITLNDRLRYYQNVCTTSYSFVWWDWNQWEQHIDWMALNSFNLVLALNGLESVWKKVYKQLNLTDEEIDEHFTGPTFLSWGRMGNIRGWGGPLSNSWHDRSLKLQKLILKRMREFGIIPVLPAFAGHVPRAFTRLFPKAKINTTSVWNRFEDIYCCPYLLDPTDPLFKIVGTRFMNELISEFGTDHVYSCDTFNEMTPSSSEPSYLKEIGQSVYAVMVSADANAIWVMQNWLFVHDFLFWTETRAYALLTSVPIGKMVVLDLQSEQFPQYQRMNSYFGQPYIWCMLHNFGGTLGMFGSSEIINQAIFEARRQPNSTLVGTGLTPEGINQNYVIYDLMAEMAWRTSPTNLTQWFSEYAKRRYGSVDDNIEASWHIFKNTVYNFKGLTKMRGRYALNQRPRTHLTVWTWYNSYDFFGGWELFLKSANFFKNSKGYHHDLVDTTRQFLQILGDEYYKEIVASFKLKNLESFEASANSFLEIFNDMEQILASNKAFLLGSWLNSAKSAASTDEDRKLFEYNARNQITLWGPRGEIVDYASKQWSGIVSKYFLPRWSLFLQNMNESLINHTEFNESRTMLQIFQDVEQPFTLDQTSFPDNPFGNTIEIAKSIYKKWWRVIHKIPSQEKVPLEHIAMFIEDYENAPIVFGV